MLLSPLSPPTSLCVTSLILKDKNAFHWEPRLILAMLEKSKVSSIFKIQILSFMTPTLFAHILGIADISQNKRVGVLKDEMCVLTIQETFVLSSICKKAIS